MNRRRRFCHIVLLLLQLLPSLDLVLGVNREGLYLQRVKLGLDDPNGVLSDWNSADEFPCKWNGVVCDSVGKSVVSVSLSSSNIAGPFPSIICRLKNLSFISLRDNSINSTLPDDLATCQSLEHLDLAQNYLTGPLPSKLAHLPNLKHLDLAGNNFSGAIPDSFGTFRKLEVLSLVDNLIDGIIPAFLGNVSTLKQLNLSYNPFFPGRIPPELGNLTHLEVLWLTGTNLMGSIPHSLGRLTRLTNLDLAFNSLTGEMPDSFTELIGLVQLELYNNSLTGQIPSRGWLKMKSLRRLDASANELTGEIPIELCMLPLESLNLFENQLRGGLPPDIARSPYLYELKVFQNQLTGELPANLGKISPLRWIDVSFNYFSGPIPENLCSHGALEDLLLIKNSFSGEIPVTFGACRSLLRVRLGRNKLSGEVPEGFWGLPHVSLFELTGNSFTGQIAKSIAEASNLSLLIVSENNFSGSVPEEIGFLENLIELSCHNNNFSGSLPRSIVNLGQLVKLDLHDNGLSGEIPNGIRNWKRLNEMNLANNEFSGAIPDEIGSLTVLNYLDLSRNQFSGKIPAGLQNLKLSRLNLSNNHLSGDVPPLFAEGMYKDSFLNNPGLCGGIAGLCDGKDDYKKVGHIWLLRLISVLTGLLLIIGAIWFYLKYMRFKKGRRSIERTKWTLTSFHKLVFREDEILDALEEDNVIGSGSSGKVYKVVLSNGEAVAVKKLCGHRKSAEEGTVHIDKGNLKDGFDAEVEMLGKIRHKSIVKLWCCCTTRDCKLLVYEYMPNGSLGDLLHSVKSGSMDWPIRFKIALDSAEGLSYLHHDSMPPIVHRDVKSNNILLDADYGARIADFGIAKVVDVSGKCAKSMSAIAGSCGYIAPEYAYTLKVNEKSDVYSFGIVILELITGKLPVDPELADKDLVKWVHSMLDQKGIQHVIDPKLDLCFEDEINKVLSIGLLCTSPLPINRPSMRRVVNMLQEISSGNHPKVSGKDGKLTPYYYEETSDKGSIA